MAGNSNTEGKTWQVYRVGKRKAFRLHLRDEEEEEEKDQAAHSPGAGPLLTQPKVILRALV